MKKNLLIVSALVLLTAAGASASNFRAADLVYVPNAGKLPGATATYETDVWISNPNSTPATVWVAFAPAGLGVNNSGAPAAAVKLSTDLAANERREINDIVGNLFPSQVGKLGHLLFFGYRQGVNSADCQATPTDCRAISVEARVFATTGGTNPRTFGMTVSGIPWYNYVSPSALDSRLREVFVTGIREFGVAGTNGFRTNIGVVNASGTQQAQLRVTVYKSDGSVAGSSTITLEPLGMLQQNVTAWAPGFTGTGWARVEQVDTGAQDLAFLAYGTLNDNQTSDITWLEAQYSMPWDEAMAQCIYGAKPPRRIAKR
ncbi:MAG TPA: hypothetical protein VFV54_01565 [Thermoanaerobaculia bacterium]|nr:hypothetical protein [Thermoanaerobaculia bacterium]